MGQNRRRGKGVKRRNGMCNGWPNFLASLGNKDERERERREAGLNRKREVGRVQWVARFSCRSREGG